MKSDPWVLVDFSSREEPRLVHSARCPDYWANPGNLSGMRRFRLSVVLDRGGFVLAQACCGHLWPAESDVDEPRIAQAILMNETPLCLPRPLRSKFARAELTLQDRFGINFNVVVGLDSCASVSLIHSRFAERCGFASAVAGHSVRNCGGATRFDRQCYMMLVTPGGALHHELAWVASEQHLPSECGALLSLDALVRIGGDMNWHGAQSAVECIPCLRG